MTTHTLTGTAIYTDPFSDDLVSVSNGDITLDFVVNDAVTSLSYTVLPPEPGSPIGEAVIDLDDYNIRLDGTVFGGTFAPVAAVVVDIDWTQNGQAHSSVILGLLFFDQQVAGVGTVDIEYNVVISGDAFPVLNTQADYDAFANSITDFANPTGVFAPGVDIPLTLLGGTSKENDRIVGTDAADTFDGGAGRDNISGGRGNDDLSGGEAADKLDGGRGRDALDGGAGIDTAEYRSATTGVTANMTNTASNTGDAFGDTYTSIEYLTGSDFDDILTGNAGNNRVNGGRGDDTLDGMAGNDILIGSAGADVLIGRAGNDVLRGGGGRDRLVGVTGDDTMTGGAGRDTFVYKTGNDTITDFGNDLLHLDDALWGNANLANAQILAFASVVGSDTVFDFGGGNTLTLEDYTDIAGLDPLLSVI